MLISEKAFVKIKGEKEKKKESKKERKKECCLSNGGKREGRSLLAVDK